MGVCLPSIWNSKCPQGVHQNSKTCDRPLKEAGSSSHHLVGRYFTDGLHRKNPIIPRDLDGHPSRNVRICGELPKIPIKSFTVNRVSGFLHKLNYSKHQPSIGQSKEYQARVSEDCGESRYHDKRPSSVARETKCLDPSSIPGTPQLSSHPSSQERQSSSAWGLRVPSVPDCGSPRTKKVERPPFCLEQESDFTKPSSTDNRDRCLHNGLGSMLWKFPDQRPLVSVRKAVTHKLLKASSRRICLEVISK